MKHLDLRDPRTFELAIKAMQDRGPVHRDEPCVAAFKQQIPRRLRGWERALERRLEAA